MSIKNILGLEASEWEEVLSAWLFENRLVLNEEAFCPEVIMRVNGMMEGLNNLPRNWARELTAGVLFAC